ncbi:hypothetical protein CM15mP35_06330 [bacterium]|nr:MAG: hypothetical protein CM15mP35_06330 [bacterium]
MINKYAFILVKAQIPKVFLSAKFLLSNESSDKKKA